MDNKEILLKAFEKANKNGYEGWTVKSLNVFYFHKGFSEYLDNRAEL